MISGNTKSGIAILGTLGATCVIQGNFIGTNAAGTVAIGNTLHGIIITGGAHNNQVGGTAAGAGNLIAFNGGAGVLIGVDAVNFNSDAGVGNPCCAIPSSQWRPRHRPERIGVTANDGNDPDTGGNNLQNFPSSTRPSRSPGPGPLFREP